MTTKKTAKKELNELKAKQRLERLQHDQKLVNELRKEGWVGTFDQILGKYHDAKRAELIALQEQMKVEQQNEREQYVTDALNGPSKFTLKTWFAGREATYERVKRFFDERPAQQRVAQIYVAVKQPADVKKAA